MIQRCVGDELGDVVRIVGRRPAFAEESGQILQRLADGDRMGQKPGKTPAPAGALLLEFTADRQRHGMVVESNLQIGVGPNSVVALFQAAPVADFRLQQPYLELVVQGEKIGDSEMKQVVSDVRRRHEADIVDHDAIRPTQVLGSQASGRGRCRILANGEAGVDKHGRNLHRNAQVERQLLKTQLAGGNDAGDRDALLLAIGDSKGDGWIIQHNGVIDRYRLCPDQCKRQPVHA
jgi:hypothetical protein